MLCCRTQKALPKGSCDVCRLRPPALAEPFFDGNAKTPLSSEKAGEYGEALENVRLAPSASINNPGVLFMMISKKHFPSIFLRTISYRKASRRFFESDIGIVMCHFELTVAELGLTGKWRQNESARK